MKRGSYVLLTVLVFLYLFTGVIAAQTIPEVALAGKASAQSTDPTVTPNSAKPTTNPSPTVTQAPTPSVQVTPQPTEQPAKPTSIPEQIEQVQSSESTVTPTPLPPTPTPKPKPKAFILPITQKPPLQPLNGVITAPFDLVMSSLPQSYYNDAGLSPMTNKVLLFAAFFCLLSGTILLNWPSLVRRVKKLFVPSLRQRKSLPYAAGRI